MLILQCLPLPEAKGEKRVKKAKVANIAKHAIQFVKPYYKTDYLTI